MRNFFKQILSADSDKSSKRFIAIWSMLIVSFIVGFSAFKGYGSSFWESILYAFLSFILALLGVATWQAVRKRSIGGGGVSDPTSSVGGGGISDPTKKV